MQCVLLASIPFSPFPASFREFKWSSHPTLTSSFWAQLSPQRGTEAQPALSRPLVCGNYLQTLKPLSVYTRPEHLCRPLGCHGLPWKMVLATPLALFQVLSCALVLIMWLWGNFLRVECGTPGPNSSRLAGRHWSPQRKSPVLQGTQCGQEVTPPTWVSDPCSVSLLSEGHP